MTSLGHTRLIVKILQHTLDHTSHQKRLPAFGSHVTRALLSFLFRDEAALIMVYTFTHV